MFSEGECRHAHLLAVLFVLMALIGAGFGIYALLPQSVSMNTFGLPVEFNGYPKVLFGIFCFVPAVLLVGFFLVMRRVGGA